MRSTSPSPPSVISSISKLDDPDAGDLRCAVALIGAACDVDRAVTSDEALAVRARAIPPEPTAMVASVEEPAVEVINGEAKKLLAHLRA